MEEENSPCIANVIGVSYAYVPHNTSIYVLSDNHSLEYQDIEECQVCENPIDVLDWIEDKIKDGYKLILEGIDEPDRDLLNWQYSVSNGLYRTFMKYNCVDDGVICVDTLRMIFAEIYNMAIIPSARSQAVHAFLMDVNLFKTLIVPSKKQQALRFLKLFNYEKKRKRLMDLFAGLSLEYQQKINSFFGTFNDYYRHGEHNVETVSMAIMDFQTIVSVCAYLEIGVPGIILYSGFAHGAIYDEFIEEYLNPTLRSYSAIYVANGNYNQMDYSQINNIYCASPSRRIT